jgi:hypothetical protein
MGFFLKKVAIRGPTPDLPEDGEGEGPHFGAS